MTDTTVDPIENQQKKLDQDAVDKKADVSAATNNSKLADSLKTDVDQVANKKKPSVDNYRAKYDVLQKRWKQQDCQISRLTGDITAVFPDYVDRINGVVCPVLKGISDQQTKVDAFAPHQGINEEAVAKAKQAADAAKARLDAWLAADATLNTRLNDVDKAIKDVQSVLGGADQVFSIYYLWFKALPPHQEIAPRDGGPASPGGTAPERQPGCLPKPDPAAVYLISPDAYAAQLDKAWDNYRLASIALKTANDAFTHAPDDLASETKALKKLRDSQDDDVKKKLKDPWPKSNARDGG